MSRRARGPTDLPPRAWWEVLKRTVKEFQKDNLTDWSAALTYYAILSIFPAIVVLTALLGVVGPSAIQALVDNVQSFAPGQARELMLGALRELDSSRGVAGWVALFGLLAAVWGASAYVGAFIRASNAVYEVAEGRPLWKTLPLRLVLTVGLLILAGLCAVSVVLTGSIADQVGQWLGIGSVGLTVWNVAKWPVLALLVSLAIALLYWAAPNVRHPGFRWLTPGSVLAVLLWLLASGGFAFYVANFASYNKTYGSLAGVVVFLIWLWISNLAILLGVEFDAELARSREIEAGAPPDQEPYLPPRDVRAMDEDEIPRQDLQDEHGQGRGVRR
ncbi:MAG TPA: YihY/virulence factor BrkB family protein [Actinophytocola sp.]|uniref:YihY/virulence factor BrkB family protein n=1 Tax=Actinophytocola sp. TaxID=1872138 RepID=UPI002DB8C1E3|nr:YihY/virulence factor BrkB family protein [Actinophytocola sp.]HEU5472895.1 YihY/virulence factor BrkB family protein [Actinophytocola sp.]